jgi:hypothetical protein
MRRDCHEMEAINDQAEYNYVSKKKDLRTAGQPHRAHLHRIPSEAAPGSAWYINERELDPRRTLILLTEGQSTCMSFSDWPIQAVIAQVSFTVHSVEQYRTHT